jgi:hypothetical protein
MLTASYLSTLIARLPFITLETRGCPVGVILAALIPGLTFVTLETGWNTRGNSRLQLLNDEKVLHTALLLPAPHSWTTAYRRGVWDSLL